MSVLTEMQNELKAPKSRYNSFGEYHYRSLEDILEAVKPILKAHDSSLIIDDNIVMLGDRYYVEATATLTTPDGTYKVSASAREALEKKKSDVSQITGAASSYARKYALNGLFLIDDTKDADTDEYVNQQRDGNEKISTKEARVIVETIVRAGVNVEQLLKQYKVEKAEDLTVDQYAHICRRLQNECERKAQGSN